MQQIVACSQALPLCVLVPTVESITPIKNDKGLHRSDHAQPFADNMGAGFSRIDATHSSLVCPRSAFGRLQPFVKGRASMLGSCVGTRVVRSFQVSSVGQGMQGLQD